ncbi:P-loop domain-containing protein [Candidatus Cyrtobacter comes]|uniref:NACHT domain-containing protein n=1 Tax=Candidatus Cyrtobacter comes TaxID=675776 RepID=UPI002ACEBB74|nr:NACHT domain-containing protein [Candidatus Cyrtobacter comes]
MSTNTKSKKHNPTSGFRKGYSYQTLCAAELCYKLLSQPGDYQSIIVEYQNDDQNHNFKFDDIVLIKTDSEKIGYQCKYSEKTWGKTEFSKLIKILSGSRESQDYNEFSEFYLQTNRVLVEEYKNKYDPTTQRFKDIELDGASEEFWNKVRFIFENTYLEEKEESVKQLFYKLKCTEDGINSLLLNLRKEEEKKYTAKINIEKLKKWLQYYDPRTLKQDFEIPQDFQYFDRDIHEKLIKELLESSCSTKVIIGSPGVGKSTYIAKLYEDLKKNKKVCSIKHHYYINNSDNDLYYRLDCDRIIEGFKANLTQDYKHLLGEKANQNLENISCEELIDELSKNLQNDSTFIIIIDGLDHCSKHGKSEELKSFLGKIYFPKRNVRYIFATQPQILDDLSIQSCDRIEMNGLSENAIYSIINQNSIKLLFPEDKYEKDQILKELFMRCEGNILYLRYILGYLKNNTDEKINIELLNKLLENFPLCEGDLNKYYNLVWKDLIWKENTDIIKRILAIATIFWRFQCFYTREQLVRCVSNSTTENWLNFQKFEHLLKYHKNHTIFFHSSFPEFIYNLKCYKDNVLNVKKNIFNWLECTKL